MKWATLSIQMKYRSYKEIIQELTLLTIGRDKSQLSNYHFLSKTDHTVIFIVIVHVTTFSALFMTNAVSIC